MNCSYYYYFVENELFYLDSPKCASNYKYLILELNQCTKSYSEYAEYTKEFRKNCYKECHHEESKEREDDPNLFKVICPYDKPFEIVESQVCVNNCTIMERRHKI